jgi:4-hydroxythreonine-4-phosphate dehydrogenase
VADFIFMLTRADRTVEDAEAHLADALSAGVRHIGFKDVGLPLSRLRALAAAIRNAGARLYLEVVSLDAESEAASARAAVELGVDVLMGGTRPDVVAPVVAGSPVRYYPFPGEIVGHPSVLEGSIDSIVASARDLLARDGVHGLDLLAYRSRQNAPELVRRVCAAAGARPVVVAGSLDRAERIAAVVEGGAAAFTVGTAALDGVFPCAPDLRAQLAYIAAARDAALGRREPSA